MRQLRYVRPGDEPELLIVQAEDDGEQFTVPVDGPLREAVHRDEPPPAVTTAPADVGAGSTLGPREIQVRVRAGADPQDLADEHGVAIERVMRFAAAVVEERRRIADEARRARARRTTTDAQTVVFGETVDQRFAAYGIDADAVRWDARRRPDGHWLIRATWVGGTGEHSADWVFHLASRQVTPADGTAADLLSDKPVRPVAVAGVRARGAPPLAPGVFAFPAMPEAHTGPLPAVEDVFDQDAADPDAPRVGAAAGRAPMHPRPAGPAGARLAPAPPAAPPTTPPAAPPAAYAPPLPLGIPDPMAAHLPEHAEHPEHPEHLSRARQRERTKIPTWDDIMLGVRRKQD
ncbi:MAG: DUF3071 domain-containing protein [Jatrophihabitans sp.]|nr:MAG: DUF3071 domain-containing protein [Jatrophihabitans sp.]